MSTDFFESLEEHTSFIDADDIALSDTELPVGIRAAQTFGNWFGSWGAILAQLVVVAVWVIAQRWHNFDPYPFGFFALVIAVLSLITNSLIVMSQNREGEKTTAIMTELRIAALKDESTSAMMLDILHELFAHVKQVQRQQYHIVSFLKEIHADQRAGSKAPPDAEPG